MMFAAQPPLRRIDLDGQAGRQVVVDREPGQYLGHPTTALLDDGKTILAVYPKGHGKGPIVMKSSPDGGKTWSERLPVPDNWATSLETPTIHKVRDPRTKKSRLILWSGLHPARIASSDDNGRAWTPLNPVGSWGGIVVMGFVEPLRDGSLLAMFHDDGRFFSTSPQATGVFTLYKTFSRDGGRTWSFPEAVHQDASMHLCEPGVVRSPDGRTMAILLRENRRQFHSAIMFSWDEGKSWTKPRAVPRELTGDRHTAKMTKDGRLFISFRNMPPGEDPWKGDWVAWVGTWDDLVNGREGQYKVRLKDNQDSWDCAYPGVELLPDDTLVATTYGYWTKGEQPYILSVRLKLAELDALAGRG